MEQIGICWSLGCWIIIKKITIGIENDRISSNITIVVEYKSFNYCVEKRLSSSYYYNDSPICSSLFYTLRSELILSTDQNLGRFLKVFYSNILYG